MCTLKRTQSIQIWWMVLDCKDADDIEMNEKYVHHEDDFDDNDLI